MPGNVPLTLASASPRRHELLRKVGCEFSVQVANVDESCLPGEPAGEYVARVAHAKAAAIQSNNPDQAILAADTIVTCDEEIFGKPRHQAHAMQMWRRMSGRNHEVVTTVCLMYQNTVESVTVSTSVSFAELSEVQMQQYWQSGEPQDKAGGYAIQGLASAWVQQVHGSYSNVVGLPLFETNHLLRLVGHNWL